MYKLIIAPLVAYLTRLRFPALFAITAVLFILDSRVRQLIAQASDFMRCCFPQCHYSKVSCCGRLGFARFKAAKTWVCSWLVVDRPALGRVPFRVMR